MARGKSNSLSNVHTYIHNAYVMSMKLLMKLGMGYGVISDIYHTSQTQNERIWAICAI